MKSTSKLVEYVKDRIKRNKNFLCVFTGPTGSGKTYSALKFAQLLDPEFTPEKRIAFTPVRFLDIINNGNLTPGSVVIFEEAGVALNNRRWQSKANILVNFVIQTFRHKNYICIFTAPDFSFVDIATRKLFHAVFETVQISVRHGLCTVKPLWIQVNQRSGKIYYKYVKVREWGNAKISRATFGLIDKRTVDLYEKSKQEFTRALNEDIERQLSEEKKKATPEKQYKCRKCEHSWMSKSPTRPQKCPRCSIRSWYVGNNSSDTVVTPTPTTKGVT